MRISLRWRVGKRGGEGPIWTVLRGTVKMLHLWSECFARFLAMGEPRGAVGAAVAVLSYGGLLSLVVGCL